MSREPCFECGKPSSRKYYVVPKQRGGTKSVPLCASCLGLTRSDMATLTKEALAKAKERGVQLGRAPLPADALALRAQKMRTSGMTRQAIADTLNAEGVPTLRDAERWTPSTVRGLLSRSALRE